MGAVKGRDLRGIVRLSQRTFAPRPRRRTRSPKLKCWTQVTLALGRKVMAQRQRMVENLRKKSKVRKKRRKAKRKRMKGMMRKTVMVVQMDRQRKPRKRTWTFLP